MLRMRKQKAGLKCERVASKIVCPTWFVLVNCLEIVRKKLLALVRERMPPKRRSKRRRAESEETEEVTAQVEDASQGTTAVQGTTTDVSAGSTTGSGRSSDPLTRGDIPAIVEEITRQLRSDSDGGHASLTPGTC